jgi:hypothetical protein
VLAKPKLMRLQDKLAAYLSTDPKYVEDVLTWWYEKRSTYPRLSRMASDYLQFQVCAKHCAINLECTLMTEQLHLLMSRIFSSMDSFYSPIFITICLCRPLTLFFLRSWSLLGLVKDEDVMNVAVMKDVEGDIEEELEDGWDSIKKN